MRVSHDSEGQRRGPRRVKDLRLDRGFSLRQNLTLTPNRRSASSDFGGEYSHARGNQYYGKPKKKKKRMTAWNPEHP